MSRLIVAGVALRGDGYPNAQQTIALLKNGGVHEVHDQAHWLPRDMHLWRIARGPMVRRGALALRLAWSGFIQGLWITFRGGRRSLVYVPYPAPLLLWWLSFLPRSWRPRCIADAYISIWDSMFRDRQRGQVDGFVSRLIRSFEGRALRAAELVLVDTEANARQIASDFAIPLQRIRSVPLAIDEARFLAIQPRENVSARVRVLFVGTMIPLHGIDALLDAIHALRNEPRIEFRLVGDGQLGNHVEHALLRCNHDRVTWLRGWHSLEVIAREIEEADICLGVFGGPEKAARVLPFKLYMYFASGRPVISQRALSVPEGIPYPPIEQVDLEEPSALSSAILRLVDDAERRNELAQAARSYYSNWLSGARLLDAWNDLRTKMPS